MRIHSRQLILSLHPARVNGDLTPSLPACNDLQGARFGNFSQARAPAT